MKPWTNHEVAFLRENYLSRGGPYCAQQLDRPLNAVHQAAIRFEIPGCRIRKDGIKTPADLMGRCRIDEISGCWLWGGAVTGLGEPRIWVPAAGGTLTGTRAAAFLAGRLDLSVDGLCAWPTCGAPACVNPDHVLVGSRADKGRWQRENGTMKGNPKMIAANVLTGRSRSRFTPEVVAEIRASTKTNAELAAELGVCHSTVGRVRLGKSWRVTMPSASVFSWRPGA